MTTAQIAQHFRNNVNWQKFVNLSHNLGDQFNDRQWRFLKASVLERAVAAYSDGTVQYVGKEGCDLHAFINNAVHTVEMKYMEDALYTPQGITARDKSQKITLMNSKGTNRHTTLPAGYADYLLVIGVRAGAIVSRIDLEPFITVNGDSIDAQVPTDRMEFVFSPGTILGPNSKIKIDLRHSINEAIDQTLQQIQ